MYDKIIVPVDFGFESNRVAAEKAIALGNLFDSEICIVHVELSTENLCRDNPDCTEKESDSIRNMKEFFRESSFENVTFDSCKGLPSAKICEYVNENDGDLIIMTTHGRSGIERMAFGSVTEETIRNAPCSVLVLE